MVAKSLKLESYGTVMITPLNIVEDELETVDPEGKAVTSKMIGTRAKTVHYNADGIEIPNNKLCKKIIIEDETIISPKFEQTKEVAKEDITEIEDPGIIYRALERKFYNVVTDNEKIKKLILDEGKSLSIPMCCGAGWKLWNGVLTNWNGRILMVCCRGDLQKELEKYSDDTVELKIEILPQRKDMKRLVKALAMTC